MQNNGQIQNTPPQEMNTASPAEHSSMGPIIGSIIIILILILGGLYFYGDRVNKMSLPEQTAEETTATNTAQVDQVMAELRVQGGTDSLSEINADLYATDASAAGSDGAAIRAQLSQ